MIYFVENCDRGVGDDYIIVRGEEFFKIVGEKFFYKVDIVEVVNGNVSNFVVFF